MPLVAGVDSSTQSCTVELRDADSGQLIAYGSAPHPPTSPPCSEQHPAQWWDALTDAMSQALHTPGVDARQVAAIAVAAQCHGLVPLDDENAVIRPAKLWNDTTSAPQAARLVAERGREWWAERCGSVPTAAFTITKLAWLAEHEPDHFARTRTVLLPHDWLTWRLCGRPVTDRSDASGTGYFSTVDDNWDTTVLASMDGDVDWIERLPRVCGPDEVAGELTRAAADALGLRSGTVVAPGAGDQHAAALGLGIVEGDTVFSLGTSGVVYGYSAEPVMDPTGTVNGVADATGGFLPLVCTLNAAKVTDTFARLLGVDHDALGALAVAAPVGSHRLSLAAFLDGERTPDRPHATGIVAGLRTDTTREELARAAYEGVLAGLLEGADALRRANVPTAARVLVTGGGARSVAYRQLLADLSGNPVYVAAEPASSVRGACVQAAAVSGGLGVGDLASRWAPPLSVAAEPRPEVDAGHVRSRYRILAEWSGLDAEPSVESRR